MRKALFLVYSVITLLCIFYGVPLSVINFNKEGSYIYFIIALIGIILLLIEAIFIMLKKRNNK